VDRARAVSPSRRVSLDAVCANQLQRTFIRRHTALAGGDSPSMHAACHRVLAPRGTASCYSFHRCTYSCGATQLPNERAALRVRCLRRRQGAPDRAPFFHWTCGISRGSWADDASILLRRLEPHRSFPFAQLRHASVAVSVRKQAHYPVVKSPAHTKDLPAAGGARQYRAKLRRTVSLCRSVSSCGVPIRIDPLHPWCDCSKANQMRGPFFSKVPADRWGVAKFTGRALNYRGTLQIWPTLRPSH